MSKEQKKNAVILKPHAKERGLYKSLLLTNPNYFGNLVESSYKPVLKISGNTYYEELGCVGYQPQQKRLEAVVYIYQPSGYGTDICGSGTSEYVRFYLSFDHGATWVDQGATSFQAFNIPEGTSGVKRLEYAVSLAVNPQQKPCFIDSIIKVRAILSWNSIPPVNQPNWTPVWGNVREASIQVEPRRFIHLEEILEASKAKLSPSLTDVIKLDTPLQSEMKALSAADLAVHYKGKGVPVHRFAFKEIMNFVSAKASLDAESFTKFLPGVKIDTGIIDQLFPKSDGNISFEELKCIGLDPNHPDTLVGVIQVKKSSGYSGGPCTHGSPEYVTFWGDFDGNGSFETCLGTAQVTVYDLPNIPDQGLFYAVRLPVDLSKYRQPCKKGPKVVRIRAILSWNVAVPCSNPDQVPVWGNREETLINISPSVQTPSGTILNLGGISVAYIDNVTGMTTSTAKFVINNYPPDSLGRACPFGGRVTVQGYPVPGYSYIVEVSQDNAIWTPVLTDLWVEDQFANLNLYKANPVTNRFDYLPFTQNAMLLLAQWDTSGNEKWYVRLSVFDGGGFLEGTDTHVIQIDNTWPEVSVNITTGTGNCGKFKIGTLLEGKYVARDVLAFGDQIGQYYVYIQPGVNPPGVGVPTPNGGLVSTLTAPGEDWKLDTTAMTPCGYTINVQAVDRTIINSQWVGHWNSASAGFCLEQPKEIAKK